MSLIVLMAASDNGAESVGKVQSLASCDLKSDTGLQIPRAE